jgi:hypothetical protein
MLCAAGDEVIAEWDTDTINPDRLTEIETEFKKRMAAGFFAVDIHEKRNQLMRDFDPNAEILLIPKVHGG